MSSTRHGQRLRHHRRYVEKYESSFRFRFDGNNKVHSMNDEGNATKETFSLNPLILYGPDFKSRSQILNSRLRYQTKSKFKC